MVCMQVFICQSKCGGSWITLKAASLFHHGFSDKIGYEELIPLRNLTSPTRYFFIGPHSISRGPDSSSINYAFLWTNHTGWNESSSASTMLPLAWHGRAAPHNYKKKPGYPQLDYTGARAWLKQSAEGWRDATAHPEDLSFVLSTHVYHSQFAY